MTTTQVQASQPASAGDVRKYLRTALAGAVLLCAAPAAAGQYTYAKILPPGYMNATVAAINDRGQIVGQTNAGSGSQQGFALSGGVYTVVPQVTGLVSVNRRGVAVGLAPVSPTQNQIDSFDLNTGTLTTLPISARLNLGPVAINDSGVVAGNFNTSSEAERGFLLFGSRLTVLYGPAGTSSTSLAGLNNHGTAVGGLTSSTGTRHGFLYSGGRTTVFDPFGSVFTTFVFVNDAGVSGGYDTNASGGTTGFTWNGRAQQQIIFPGAGSTFPVFQAVNGPLVGYFYDASGKTHGFVRVRSKYFQIDVPDSAETTITGVNKAGDLVGSYFVTGTGTFGFVATCPPAQAPCTR